MEYAKQMVALDNGWSKEHVNRVEAELYRFLTLKADDDDLSPSKDIDVLWHQILLDTSFYYKYCMDNYGKIIQHYPQNSHNATKREKRLQKTKMLYNTVFNKLPPDDVWNETLIVPSRTRIYQRSIYRRPKSVRRCGFRSNRCDDESAC